MAYQQTLYKIVEPIKHTTLYRLNKSKSWEYGYNPEHDIVVISKTGQIGEIYEIQNLKITLPKEDKVDKSTNKWQPKEYPKELKSIKTIFEWEKKSEECKSLSEDLSTQYESRLRSFNSLYKQRLGILSGICLTQRS